MISKIKIFLAVIVLLVVKITGQNILSVEDVTAEVGDTVTVNLNVTNADSFVALQADIILPGAVSYINGSAILTNRADDHSLSANLVDGDTLRIIAFSINQKIFSGNSGAVLSFMLLLKDQPGNYPVEIKNALLANSNSENILTDVEGGELTIKKKSVTKTVNINKGWNIVSMPLTADDMYYQSIFPSAASQPYVFNAGYQKVDSLETNPGYWLKFSDAVTQTVEGVPAETEEIQVEEGWNLIGSFADEVSTQNIYSIPDGIIESPFFEFENGYVVPERLLTGKGYWIKTNSEGSLLVSGNTNPEQSFFSAPSVKIDFTASTDQGEMQIVSIGIDSTATEGIDTHLGEQELPPPPPSEIFFIRFALPNSFISSYSDIRFGELDENYTYEYELQFQLGENAAELTLQWEQPQGVSINIQDMFGGVIINEDFTPGSNEFTLTNANITSLILTAEYSGVTSVEYENKPIDYSLYQNSPNPFNPSTSIKYQVASIEKVSLRVYDILGSKIATLVNEIKSPGKYEAIFDASELSSGIYFYRIKAGSFIDTKKMILIK